MAQNMNNTEAKPAINKEKVMSYEEKSVGTTAFFKCEACPYMALAEDDIKFHLFTVHPDLAKTNGLAENIQILCPGCTSAFDAEETLRNHLRNHHKMGIKDIRKMIKSLVQIALKNAKLKKELNTTEPPKLSSPVSVRQDLGDVRIPPVIEIVPDPAPINENLPQGVAFISVDELQKMSTPNFEKVNPKDIIQEASINIVYTNNISTQYVNVSEPSSSSNTCNLIQVSSVTPDLISSVQPHIPITDTVTSLTSVETTTQSVFHPPPILPRPGRPKGSRTENYAKTIGTKESDIEERLGKLCSRNSCHVRLKDEEKLTYHRKCHQNSNFQCLECKKVCLTVESLHTHLWKEHSVDMELPTCEICGYKTYKKHRLYNTHMRCHGNFKPFSCPECSKTFKNSSQLAKHKLIHKTKTPTVPCTVCPMMFATQSCMKTHVATVHEKIKPFKCCHCDYTAARKVELKLHLRSHTGDKPYGCDQCSYRSGDHNAMRRHKIMHTKDKLYKCKYCHYTCIQSTAFASHMISKHPNVSSNDVHRCPYCRFKSISKDKYVSHLTTHADKEAVKILLELNQDKSKPSWTIPSDNQNNETTASDSSQDNASAGNMPIEVYDCDSLQSLSEGYPSNYSGSKTIESSEYNQQAVTDLSKDDNNSDCLISESSNDTIMERQYTPQHHSNTAYNDQATLFLGPTVTLGENLITNSSVNLISRTPIDNTNNIMSNFPIRLPPAPQISVRNNITLKPDDKIPLPMTKVIKPTQILPIPSSSSSPVNINYVEPDGGPRKKPKISVKSNLILKGPDQENMFHSQQKLAFRRLEDHERFGLGGPVTFNNLITTQFMQLPPEPALSESPSDIMPYPTQTMLRETSSTPGDAEIADRSPIFTFNQRMNVPIPLLPPQQKIQTTDPNYIKLEATIKQNTQSPSLERMCNVNAILNSPSITREYKASPPLEDIHKNLNEIKNEVKSDSFYSIPSNNAPANAPTLDQYLMDNMMGEYPGHLDLSAPVLQDLSGDRQNDVIEIDDNSDDTKQLRFDMNFPLESFYLMHNDFHFLESEMPVNNLNVDMPINEINRIVSEVPIINQKEAISLPAIETQSGEYQNMGQDKKDPNMNTAIRPCTNKINVKNIELMKN